MASWIALEGGEGSGKSTQARLLADALDAVLTREPGGTPIGSRVRALLLDPEIEDLDPRAEALLMAADRAQHVAEVVGPALLAGLVVVSDRSAWSSLAYQGYGRRLPIDELWRLSDFALRTRWPDLAVLIDVPPIVAVRRVARRGGADRLDLEDRHFHARVRSGFAALMARWPDRWVAVDGTGTEEEVAARVLGAVHGRIALDG